MARIERFFGVSTNKSQIIKKLDDVSLKLKEIRLPIKSKDDKIERFAKRMIKDIDIKMKRKDWHGACSLMIRLVPLPILWILH